MDKFTPRRTTENNSEEYETTERVYRNTTTQNLAEASSYTINDLENYESTSDKDRPKIIKSLYTKQSSRFKQKNRKSHRRIDQIDIEDILYSSTFFGNKEESKISQSKAGNEVSVTSYE